MVFVTVGSQKFPFNRLLQSVDECVADGSINDKVFAQIGDCSYVPKSYESAPFLNHDEFARMMESASVVVTHGGTGVIVGALKMGKRVVAMARLARLGEHVDDHQVQLLEQFENAGLILTCEDASSLAEAYHLALNRVPVVYRSSNTEFIKNLDHYLQSCS